MRFEALKVGELAQRTGLTVRTLHHYDEIGLLKPSLRTEAGHRLYDADDEFLQIIKEMTMMDKYYTHEQREYLKNRAEEMGPERIRQGSQDWAELIALVRAEMEKGTDPAAPQVQALAQRWLDLVSQFTGGDPGIEQSVKRLWQEQGDALAAQHGAEYDPRPLSEYIGKAIAALTGRPT